MIARDLARFDNVAEDEKLLPPSVIAQLLGCSVRTLERMGTDGPPMVRISDRIRGCRLGQFRKWLDARTETGHHAA